MSKTEVLEKIDAHTMSPVRVSLPASVAADLGRLKKAFGNVLEQLGCPGCCSGRDILWEIQQDFSLDKDLKAAPQALRSGSKKSDAKALRVGISPRLGGDIQSVYSALERIRFEGLFYRRDIAAERG